MIATERYHQAAVHYLIYENCTSTLTLVPSPKSKQDVT